MAGRHFWNDCWTGKVPLAACFPNLVSHAKVKEIHEFLVPRLSRMSAGELEQVLGIITEIVLEDRPDNRICPFAAADGVLQAGPVYKAIKTHGISQSLLLLAWSNCAPPRVQFFAWLLIQKRIQCRANLKKKSIVEDDNCELCKQALESAEHLIFRCPFAENVWTKKGFSVDDALVGLLWDVRSPESIPAKQYHVFLLLLSWKIWKHRNDVVFQHMEPSFVRLGATLKEAACPVAISLS